MLSLSPMASNTGSDGSYAGIDTTRSDFVTDKRSKNGDTVDVDQQYGLKVNVGDEWSLGGSLYGIIGAGHYSYDASINGGSADDSQFRSLLGIGATYRFSDSLSSHREVTSTGAEISIIRATSVPDS